MKIKKIKYWSIAIMMALFLAACGESHEANVADHSDDQITITHESGTTVVKHKPARVIVFDFGSLDTLEALNVEIIGLPKANLPTYLDKYKAERYTDFGGLKEPDFEKIHAAKPDLIIISGRQAPVYEQFSEIAPTINMNIDYAKYMASLTEHVAVFSEIFDKKAEADQWLSTLKTNVKALHDKAQSMPDRALILLVNDGKISAYGAGSRFGFIHDELGLKQADEKIAISTHGQSVSFEYVMKVNPDYLFVVDRSAVVGNSESSAKQVIENELVKNSNAYKNGHIVYLDPNIWYLSGGGLKSTQEMTDEIGAALNR